MKRLIFVVIVIVTFASCVGNNMQNAKDTAINGGDEITRKDGHKYIVLYDPSGNIATMCHAGDCPKH